MSGEEARAPGAIPQPRVAVLTISDGVAAGMRPDASGDVIVSWLQRRGSVPAARMQVPDATDRIAAALVELCDDVRADVVITTGGTGLTSRDVTPEATLAVIQREAAGIAERIRAAGASHTPYAALSRGVAGVRGRCLIVNLPGSEGGVRDGLDVLDPLLDHAVQLLRGVNTHMHQLPHG